MIATMQLTINGEAKTCPGVATITDLIGHLELSGRRVAVEVNKQLVPRAQHAEHRLADGDTVEIVTLVGGG